MSVGVGCSPPHSSRPGWTRSRRAQRESMAPASQNLGTWAMAILNRPSECLPPQNRGVLSSHDESCLAAVPILLPAQFRGQPPGSLGRREPGHSADYLRCPFRSRLGLAEDPRELPSTLEASQTEMLSRRRRPPQTRTRLHQPQPPPVAVRANATPRYSE